MSVAEIVQADHRHGFPGCLARQDRPGERPGEVLRVQVMAVHVGEYQRVSVAELDRQLEVSLMSRDNRTAGIPLAGEMAYDGPRTVLHLAVYVHAGRSGALEQRDAIVATLCDHGAVLLATDDDTDVYLGWDGRTCPACGCCLPAARHGPGTPLPAAATRRTGRPC